MIKQEKTKYHHQNKRQIRNSSVLSKSNFGERNIRPRKRLLADNYLYCDTCMKYSDGLCPQGCQTYESNREISFNLLVKQADHAKHTVPLGIKITTSNIPNAGLGAFAIKAFSKNTFFGPYTGERHRSTERANQSGYAWTIEDAEGNVYNYIDASDPRRSNWLRYVNCPINIENENLAAIQFNGELYYRTSRDVNAGEELFVYYGEEYARALGIGPFEYSSIEDNPMTVLPSPLAVITVKKEQEQMNSSKKRKRSRETLSNNNSRYRQFINK